MPSYLNVPSGTTSIGTNSSSFTLVNGASPGAEAPTGSFSFADLEGKDTTEQVLPNYSRRLFVWLGLT